MDGSTDLFDEEGDQLVRNYTTLEKYITIFDTAKTNNRHLIITVRNGELWDSIAYTLTFEATPNHISIIDGITTFYFDNCKINGQLKAACTYYPFDDILDMYPMSDSDTSASFEVIEDPNAFLDQLTLEHMPISQIHNTLMNTSLEFSQPQSQTHDSMLHTPHSNDVTCSTPTDVNNHQTLSDVTLSPVKQAPSITITPAVTPHYTEMQLHIADECVEDAYLKLFWKNHEHTLPYDTWVINTGLRTAFNHKTLTLITPRAYTKLMYENPTFAAQLYNQWYDSFSEHLLPFDHWYYRQPETLPVDPEVTSAMAASRLIDVQKWQEDAFDLVDQERNEGERRRLETLRQHWTLTLIKQHSMPFTEFLKSQLSDTKVYEGESEFQISLNNIKDTQWFPHLFLCLKDEGIAFHDLENISDFVLNRKHKTIVNDPNAMVSPSSFLPGERFSRMFIPNYVVIPYTLATTLHVEEIISHTHIQHILWTRLHAAHRRAYANFQINELTNTSTPLERLRMTTLTSDSLPPIQIPDSLIVQQSHARIYTKRQGGVKMLYRTEFYDLFFRPLEFLVGRGMPMHRLLLEAAYDFSERCNLFKLMLEFSGHNIDMPIPCDVHWFFAEITKIRHLHASDLLPSTTHNKAPLLRLDALPKSPEQSNPAFTKPVPTIQITDFAEGNQFHKFRPHPFLPLPLYILDKFPSHGGQRMSTHMHIRLHEAFLQAYERFTDKYGSDTTTTFTNDNATDKSSDIRHNERGLQFQHNAQAMPDDLDWDLEVQQETHTSPSLLQKPSYAQKAKTSYPVPKKRQDKVLPKPVQLDKSDSVPHQPILDLPVPQSTTPVQRPNIPPPLLPHEIPQPRSPPSSQSPILKDQLLGSQENQLSQFNIFQQQLAHLQQLQTEIQQQLRLSYPEQPQNQPLPQQVFYVSVPNQFQQQPQPISLPGTPPPQLHHVPQQVQVQQPEPFLVLPNMPAHAAKPDWLQPQPADDKILPSSLLWTCRNNQHRPLWTSQPHSAASLHDKVTKTVALFPSDRYDTKPFYRQIPIDGVNAKSTLTIHYSSQHEQEDVIITTKTAPIINPKLNLKPKPDIRSTLTMPVNLFNRFMQHFYDLCSYELPPADNEIHRDTFTLHERDFTLAKHAFKISIQLSEGVYGKERIAVLFREEKVSPPTYNNESIRIPWIHLMDTLTAMRNVHQDLMNHKLL
jgi:hypothetical protein